MRRRPLCWMLLAGLLAVSLTALRPGEAPDVTLVLDGTPRVVR